MSKYCQKCSKLKRSPKVTSICDDCLPDYFIPKQKVVEVLSKVFKKWNRKAYYVNIELAEIRREIKQELNLGKEVKK